MKTPTKPTIKLNPVKSSNVQSTGYDPLTKTLAVQFKGGKTYHYTDVPEALFGNMGKCESVGKFIGANVVGIFKHTTIA